MFKWQTSEISLPPGWEEANDYDGKLFYIDHNTQTTSWIDPRDRETKPQTFADCIGNELPYGWEQAFDANVGVYYINHITETNQLEDPRVQWRETQQEMLKEYLITAQEDLEATREICTVKEQRLQLAQEDFKHFTDALGGWKSSHTSLNSNSSVGSTKYDPDLLKADVSLAKQRVARLKQELEQVRVRVHYKEQGVETLAAVDQKLSSMDAGYTVDEAQAIINQIKKTKKCLNSEEKQKQDLMLTLAKLKDDLTLGRNNGSSPDVSTLSIPQEKASTASQTDITLELNLSSENKLAEQTRIRLHYDELRKTISNLKMQLIKTQSQMVPGQKESDKDRLLLLQEKEQLLRELKSIDDKGRSEQELSSIQNRIAQLENDIRVAVAISTKSIADRLKLEDHKVNILQQLHSTSKLVTLLESQLKSTSTSQLSISSGSSLGSLGSLGSLSASSHGSLASTSMTDIYKLSNENLQDLHRCVGQRLLGHSITPGLAEKEPTTSATATGGGSTGTSLSTPVDNTSGFVNPLTPRKGSRDQLNQGSSVASATTAGATATSEQLSLSPHSSFSSLSPPTSPYDIGPPPSYEQHMNAVERQKRMIGQASSEPGTATTTSNATTLTLRTLTPTLSTGSDSTPSLMMHNTNTTGTVPLFHALPYMLQVLDSDVSASTGNVTTKQTTVNPQSGFVDNTDIASNPPLSPISESSSGVCNNLSGVNTSSVSAAVSDESVAGDSGVFEAAVKRPGELDDFLQMESAQIKIILKYESYDSYEGMLNVEIDQARNLGALTLPHRTKVGIRAALLPLMSTSWETKPSKELRNPKFGETFKVAILKNMLRAQTLQVNVWSFPDKKEPECLGCAHISLADFNQREVSVRWYNVLSFKFMQSDMKQTMQKDPVTTESCTQVCNSLQTMDIKQTMRKDPITTETCTQMCDKLLNAVKDKIGQLSMAPASEMRKTALCEERSIDASKDNRMIHPFLSFGKEESSDESTIISSQTSTLTRNQGPEDMQSHEGDPREKEEEEEEEEDEEEEEESMKEKDLSVGWLMFENYQSAGVAATVDEIKMCDRGTNTDAEFEICKVKKRTTEHVRKSTIRRSQTFSPADRQGSAYVCKLNRSDSDSSMALYKRGPFQRNSTGRQSLRWKKLPGATASAGGRRTHIRTSVDLELDLQASQRRLGHLRDDISRLKELKKGMEDAKERGENELPSWLTDDENFQRLLSEADRLAHKSENEPSCSKTNKRAEQLVKKVTRDVQKLQKNFFPNAFSEKMAFFTVDNTTVPVIPSNTTDDRFEEFLNDERAGEEV